MATNTAPTKPAVREYRRNESHTIRKRVRFGDGGLVAGVAFGALPAGAIVTALFVLVKTAFNAATTNPLLIGTTPTGAEFAAATDTVAQTLGVKRPDVASLVGPMAADTVVYVSYNPTGAAPTAGEAYIVLHYTPDNDG